VESLNNLYWNGGRPVPDGSGVLRLDADPAAVVADPLLPPAVAVVPPRWDPATASFAGGYETFSAAFAALAAQARTGSRSPAIDQADAAHMPLIDLLGRPRGVPDIGALEHRPLPTPTPAPPGKHRAWLPLLMHGRGR
jgi:hypothetical protein